MTIFLHGLSAQFYRGIGPEQQDVGPFSRVNFFIGANNSGKSIILNLISEKIKKSDNNKIKPEDEYKGKINGKFEIKIYINSERVENINVYINEINKNIHIGAVEKHMLSIKLNAANYATNLILNTLKSIPYFNKINSSKIIINESENTFL